MSTSLPSSVDTVDHRSVSQGRLILRRFLGNPAGVVSLIVLLAIVV
ncbi:hypothetical protein ACSTHG_23675, partial [Vibrio parahaemolyticus]